MQRRIMAALVERAETDWFLRPDPQVELYDWLFERSSAPMMTARWRWYTVDLLGVIGAESSRAERSSAHRAVRALAREGLVQTHAEPYPHRIGGLDLSELSRVDARWPVRSGPRLWFRLPGPPDIEDVILDDHYDDQVAAVLTFQVYRPEPFEDFVGATDRVGRWATPTGQFLAWVFCGGPGHKPVASSADYRSAISARYTLDRDMPSMRAMLARLAPD